MKTFIAVGIVLVSSSILASALVYAVNNYQIQSDQQLFLNILPWIVLSNTVNVLLIKLAPKEG